MFFNKAGVMDEESPDFEMKMMQFVDWYCLTRPLNISAKRPIEACFDEPKFSMSEEEKPYFVSLLNHRHSLFEFLKFSGKDLTIRDLFSQYKLTIKDSPITIGFEKNEIFEGRLIPYKDSFIFSRAFCFHPPQAKKFILKEVKMARKLPAMEQAETRESLILTLYRMRARFDQYKHVDATRIYSNDSGIQ